jgi:hypothetical protein
MSMLFLTLTALVEAATGVALIVVPSEVALLLVGAPLETPPALLVGRVAGVALVALGIACWQARSSESAGGRVALVAPMLLYNVAITALLAHAWSEERYGPGLWFAVVLHAVLAIWSAEVLRRGNRKSE